MIDPEAQTLLLRLAGPMQSWGLDSRFDQRDTALEPSKSGVIGMLCAAIGKPRDDRDGPWPRLSALAQLRMGVRVLSEGTIGVDFLTAGGGSFAGRKNYRVWRASGGPGGTVVSLRQYLADADFLVGLEGPLPLLRSLEAGLRAPVWPLFLGRKSYVPGAPVLPACESSELGAIRTGGVLAVLREFRDASSPLGSAQSNVRQRFVVDVPLIGAPERRLDVPRSFEKRHFGARGVETVWLEVAYG